MLQAAGVLYYGWLFCFVHCLLGLCAVCPRPMQDVLRWPTLYCWWWTLVLIKCLLRSRVVVSIHRKHCVISHYIDLQSFAFRFCWINYLFTSGKGFSLKLWYGRSLSCLVYDSEILLMKMKQDLKLDRIEMHMNRWICRYCSLYRIERKEEKCIAHS